jgi:hypothetical protein
MLVRLRPSMKVLTAEGYTAVLGTNCEQEYVRTLKVAEQVRNLVEYTQRFAGGGNGG